MNSKLLVSLLRKNIEELEMITAGFMEMEEYPLAIITLAKRKTEDIQTIIQELGSVNLTTAPVTGSAEIKAQVIDSEDIAVTTPAEEVKLRTETIPEPVIVETIIQHVVEVEIQPETEPEPEVIELPAIQPDETTVSPTLISTENTEMGKEPLESTRKATIAEKFTHQTTSRNESLSKEDNSLSATLANKKISDIKLAISIGDRFRFQRELFKSNGEDMNKTLTYINQLATLNEAMGFLASKYNWDETNEAVDDFYQIVKRKFA